MSLTLKTDDFKSGTKADVNRHGAANGLKLEKKVLVNNKIKASGKKKVQNVADNTSEPWKFVRLTGF